MDDDLFDMLIESIKQVPRELKKDWATILKVMSDNDCEYEEAIKIINSSKV